MGEMFCAELRARLSAPFHYPSAPAGQRGAAFYSFNAAPLRWTSLDSESLLIGLPSHNLVATNQNARFR